MVFIDEAHQITERANVGDTYATELFTTLVKICEQGGVGDVEVKCPVFVLAGYTQGMKEFMEHDPGMPRRFLSMCQYRCILSNLPYALVAQLMPLL